MKPKSPIGNIPKYESDENRGLIFRSSPIYDAYDPASGNAKKIHEGVKEREGGDNPHGLLQEQDRLEIQDAEKEIAEMIAAPGPFTGPGEGQAPTRK